jgi:hypothetical protein
MMEMDTMIAVEKSVEMPMGNGGRKVKNSYPYEKMEVGDSFLVNGGSKSLMSQMCTKNKREGERLGKKFVARRVDDGVRIWRAA